MSDPYPSAPADPNRLETAADRAARAIPPVWPLASSVAVNPFLGQTGESLARAGVRLARVAGVARQLPSLVDKGREVPFPTGFRVEHSARRLLDVVNEAAIAVEAGPKLLRAEVAVFREQVRRDQKAGLHGASLTTARMAGWFVDRHSPRIDATSPRQHPARRGRRAHRPASA